MATTPSSALTTQSDAGGQTPATGGSRPSPLSFFDPNGRPVSIVAFIAGDMASHGGHMSASSKDGSPADRVMIALVSEISSAFVQGGAVTGPEATVAAALEGLDWNDFRRFTASTNF